MSAQERARIMGEARANVATKTAMRTTQWRGEDPLRRWKREAEELENERKEARREERRAERQQAREQRAQRADSAEQWERWLDNRLAAERDFTNEVVARFVVEYVAQEVKAAVGKLEGENAKLRTQLLEQVASIRDEVSKVHMSLSKRQAENESRAVAGMQQRMREVDEMRVKFARLDEAARRYLEECAQRDMRSPLSWK